ncbi:TetR/AcrR family transcriptional regulator [Amycolatopsis sp. NPDC088138]|uniref:TetR/AcrR family transcriptional regulator n=1 Tax=Amycolatopsis sp. NPDC088138 TaxID=3363938 RepID=UPI003829DB71
MPALKQTRRERLRAEAAEEIKTIALEHMAANGTAAVSLRAIAREMGMTAGAIYSYYDTRDDLITALVADVYNHLADMLEGSLAAAPDDPAAKVQAYGEAYWAWATANPQKFRLIYGDPAPDYQVPPGGAIAEAEHRVCGALTSVVAGAWVHAQHLYPADGHRWSDFDPGFAALVKEAFPELPPAGVALAMRVWGRLHGLVSLQVYGHLLTQIQDPETLYRGEIADLVRALGLTPAPPRGRRPARRAKS